MDIERVSTPLPLPLVYPTCVYVGVFISCFKTIRFVELVIIVPRSSLDGLQPGKSLLDSTREIRVINTL